MARRGRRAWRTRRPAARWPPAAACRQQAEPVQRLGRRQHACCPRCVATPADSATSRRSMSTNRPDSGRLDQSALAVTWNSTIRPAPCVACGHQRRAVGQRRPGVAGEVGATARPAPGGSPSPRPAPPGRRTARPAGNGARPAGSLQDIAPPSWRSPPSSFTGSSGSVSSIGCSAVRGPAKRISRPPFSHPLRQRVALRPGRQRPVGQDQHRQLALQQRRQVAVAQLGDTAPARGAGSTAGR